MILCPERTLGPEFPTWQEHHAIHDEMPSSQAVYVLDEVNETYLYCWRCRIHVHR